jgi:hypothetical protein
LSGSSWQADAREQARKQEAVQRELGDASFTPSKSARQLELENTSLQRDLLAANAKRLDAEKRITALEHEVMTLTDVSHRLTDQLTKVLQCDLAYLVLVLRVGGGASPRPSPRHGG